jgi:hypothetical protein
MKLQRKLQNQNALRGSVGSSTTQNLTCDKNECDDDHHHHMSVSCKVNVLQREVAFLQIAAKLPHSE